MKVSEFKEVLRDQAGMELAFELPGGGRIPAHFHITEVGHVRKAFVDCGGTRRVTESCVLQAWVAEDLEHRIEAGKLLGIFRKAGDLLPDGGLPVEVEHEAPVLSAFPVTGWRVEEGSLVFELGLKHADCLAKELCVPDFRLPAIGGTNSCCGPTGCC